MPADNIVTAMPAVVHPACGNGIINGGAEFYKADVAPITTKPYNQK